jgi:nucleoside triphosphatase
LSEQRYPEPTVGALIFNEENKVLLVQTDKWHDKYVVPGGHIELGERMEESLLREVKEETGLDVYDVELELVQEFIYDESFHKRRHFIFFDFTCKTDADEDDVVLNFEAQAYVWVSLEEALGMEIDSYTRRLIEKATSDDD